MTNAFQKLCILQYNTYKSKNKIMIILLHEKKIKNYNNITKRHKRITCATPTLFKKIMIKKRTFILIIALIITINTTHNVLKS